LEAVRATRDRDADRDRLVAERNALRAKVKLLDPAPAPRNQRRPKLASEKRRWKQLENPPHHRIIAKIGAIQ
jgi:hypothetical protein